MKRGYMILAIGTLLMAVGGLLLSFTLESGLAFRSTLSQVLIVLSLIGLVASAVLRPQFQRASAVSGTRGAVSEDVKKTCTFADVAANDQALRSLMELRDYLKNPEKYLHYGARMPKGVLLYGPPGTGKTLLARALAGEAGVPFFALSGSDFVEKYVGVGAGRVRELFKRARKAGKCVIFIDEIDAMGKRRDETSSDERDQTLNALLSEMSGFYTGDGVIVIAATNRIEMLDPALLRPGRFDRQIEVGLPGKRERLSILQLHSQNKPMAEDVCLEDIAAQTTCFSGASLENLLNEAAILAAMRGTGRIEMQDIRSAFYKTVAGEDRESVASHEERLIIALHEAGHALASRLLMPENRLARVSILPAGHGAAGYNLSIPPERVMLGKKQMEDQVCVLLAGRAAELLVGGEEAITAGASSDIARATELVAAMVTELGMAGEPAVSLKTLNRSCGGGNNASDLCRKMLEELYGRVHSLLSENIDALTRLSQALVKAESLTGEEVEAVLKLDAVSNERRESA